MADRIELVHSIEYVIPISAESCHAYHRLHVVLVPDSYLPGSEVQESVCVVGGWRGVCRSVCDVCVGLCSVCV